MALDIEAFIPKEAFERRELDPRRTRVQVGVQTAPTVFRSTLRTSAGQKMGVPFALEC